MADNDDPADVQLEPADEPEKEPEAPSKPLPMETVVPRNPAQRRRPFLKWGLVGLGLTAVALGARFGLPLLTTEDISEEPREATEAVVESAPVVPKTSVASPMPDLHSVRNFPEVELAGLMENPRAYLRNPVSHGVYRGDITLETEIFGVRPSFTDPFFASNGNDNDGINIEVRLPYNHSKISKAGKKEEQAKQDWDGEVRRLRNLHGKLFFASNSGEPAVLRGRMTYSASEGYSFSVVKAITEEGESSREFYRINGFDENLAVVEDADIHGGALKYPNNTFARADLSDILRNQDKYDWRVAFEGVLSSVDIYDETGENVIRVKHIVSPIVALGAEELENGARPHLELVSGGHRMKRHVAELAREYAKENPNTDLFGPMIYLGRVEGDKFFARYVAEPLD